MNTVVSILLLVLIVFMLVSQIIMLIDHKKSAKLTDEVSRKMIEDIDLSIKQKLENDKKTKKGSEK